MSDVMESELAQMIDVSGLEARYDAAAKKLVAQKSILAYILKSTMDEFSDVPVKTIAEELIEGSPQVAEVAVHQDAPDAPNGTRLISAQKGSVFQKQEYGKIQKVVSIWVCESTAVRRSDTINEYYFHEKNRRGDYREDKKNYDLMRVIVMRLGSHGNKSEDNAIRLLSKLFSSDLTAKEKKKALSEEFHII